MCEKVERLMCRGLPLSAHVFICHSANQMSYVETSAKNRSNVDKAFHDLIRVIR